jgi:glucose-1-phosphate thymidylyltransferase
MRRAGVVDVVFLVAAAESATVRACVAVDGPPGLNIEYVPYGQIEAVERAQEERQLEQALATAAELVGDQPCVIHAAEGLLDEPLERLTAAPGEAAFDLAVFVQRPAGDADSIDLASRRLLHLDEVARQEWPLEPTGAALFGAGALSRAGASCWWSGGTLNLVAVAEQLVAAGGRLRVQRVRGWRCATGEVADLLALNRIALDALPLEREGVPGEENGIDDAVHMHPTACVQSSTIVGPAIVGPNAVVLDSYIGPYTSIGADVYIEGAEIERSVILPGARITHIGGRLVGSVVGRRARVFRDFSLPRALRLNVGDGGEVALC